MSAPKRLEIPYLSALDNLDDPDRIIHILDREAPRRNIDSVNWADRYPYRPLTTIAVAHSRDMLYIDFFVRCNYLRAENYVNQSPVSEDSCIEFFVEPTGELPYWNFEFNCIGTVNASVRSKRSEPTRLTEEQIATIRRYPSCGTRPFRELEGLFTWNLLVGIPFELIGIKYEGKPIEMRGNFYKCASAASQPHFLSWNPIDSPEPDFHRPEFFGDLVLL